MLIGCFEPVAKPWGMQGIGKDFSFESLPPDIDHFMPVLEKAVTRMPVLQDVGIQTWFNGPESFTPDDRYLLGECPEVRDLFVAAGSVVAPWPLRPRPVLRRTLMPQPWPATSSPGIQRVARATARCP